MLRRLATAGSVRGPQRGSRTPASAVYRSTNADELCYPHPRSRNETKQNGMQRSHLPAATNDTHTGEASTK